MFLYLFFILINISQTSVAKPPEKDSDFDGIADAIDKCPNTAQLNKVSADFIYRAAVDPARLTKKSRSFPVDKNGCEYDNDGDGIVNSKDYCPDNSPESLTMGVAANGCPVHSDYDGTPDYRDKCPDTASNVKTDKFGCIKQEIDMKK